MKLMPLVGELCCCSEIHYALHLWICKHQSLNLVWQLLSVHDNCFHQYFILFVLKFPLSLMWVKCKLYLWYYFKKEIEEG